MRGGFARRRRRRGGGGEYVEKDFQPEGKDFSKILSWPHAPRRLNPMMEREKPVLGHSFKVHLEGRVREEKEEEGRRRGIC